MSQPAQIVLRHPDHGHLYVSSHTWNDPIYALAVAIRDGFTWIGATTWHTDRVELLPYLWFERQLGWGEWADPRDWPEFLQILADPQAFADRLSRERADLHRRILAHRQAECARTDKVIVEWDGRRVARRSA